jgi:hypothetical protein
LNSGKPELHRPQPTGYGFEDRWATAMTDPQVVNGKPRSHLPISVRTA